jgi:hypothetical protein
MLASLYALVRFPNFIAFIKNTQQRCFTFMLPGLFVALIGYSMNFIKQPFATTQSVFKSQREWLRSLNTDWV